MKAAILLTLVCISAQAQYSEAEFQRQFYAQNLEQVSSFIQSNFDLGMNVIVLDTADAADNNFFRGNYQNPTYPGYFLVSGYNPQTTLGSVTAPGCVIVFDYNKRKNFELYTQMYQPSLGVESKNFVNYMLLSHEIGHCLARKTLGINAISENYADALASFFINHSPYKNMTTTWINNLKQNEGMHQTYNYVSRFYDYTKNSNNLSEVLGFLARNK